MLVQFTLNGEQVEVDVDRESLLEVLRDRFGLRAAKDGCSPQGQCGCCTVWVDGAPRVACVTPAQRVRGRSVTTLEGLEPERRDRWTNAFADCGASQCGFCTPGIIMRLAALDDLADPERVDTALLAHLCRCTGWQTIKEAAALVAISPGSSGPPTRPDGRAAGSTPGQWGQGRNRSAAADRARLEGGVAQAVGPHVAAGEGGFADDTAPHEADVAILDPDGRAWVVAGSLSQARRTAGKVQGRRTTMPLRHPVEVADGDWALTLQTTWVEPAYLETDASWCEPGGLPMSALGNGGAFGGKADSPLPAAALGLARERRRPVRALWSREDTVRLGPKRPPLAAGINVDGAGVVRVARTAGVAAAVGAVWPEATVEEVDLAGPPTSVALRGAGWVEAAVLLAGLHAMGDAGGHGEAGGGTQAVELTSPAGASASVSFDGEAFRVSVACGDPLDDVVLRSYCIGAVHMAYSWVTSEGVAVDEDGRVHDLTVRSFGIVRAKDMPTVDVVIGASDRPAVNGSDAVFAAAAAATWIYEGLPPRWPTRGRTSP